MCAHEAPRPRPHLATALLAASPASSASFPTSEDLLAIDDALLHGTITPPGTPLLEKEKELRAYDDLVQGYPSLTEDEITAKYFKDGSCDVLTDVSREHFPRAGWAPRPHPADQRRPSVLLTARRSAEPRR